jgi:hypothetical protein
LLQVRDLLRDFFVRGEDVEARHQLQVAQQKRLRLGVFGEDSGGDAFARNVFEFGDLVRIF